MHAWLIPALLARPNKQKQQVLEQFAPPGTKHRWLNNPQDDPSLVFCLKMDTGYAAASDIFNAPFGVRLPNAILGKPFFGEFEYLVRFCACLHRRPCPGPALPLCRLCSSYLPPLPHALTPPTQGDGKIAFLVHPACSHKGCQNVKEPRPTFKAKDGSFSCEKHAPA